MTTKTVSIQRAMVSKSGATLGLEGGDGTWYRSHKRDANHWPALQELVGHTVILDINSTRIDDGTYLHWINDWKEPSGAASSPTSQQSAGEDRQTTITALAILKACEPFASPRAAVTAYWTILDDLAAGPEKSTEPDPQAQQDGFDDEVPF